MCTKLYVSIWAHGTDSLYFRSDRNFFFVRGVRQPNIYQIIKIINFLLIVAYDLILLEQNMYFGRSLKIPCFSKALLYKCNINAFVVTDYIVGGAIGIQTPTQ